MTDRHFYVTTAIPYVNGDPHVGHALECVQADVLARHRRARGDHVRLLSGTDDNALKNVVAAEAAGVPIADFVAAKAERFAALREVLDLSYDDFIRTSVDPRHRPGVERLWRACAAAGDLYERDYDGLYCTGCEAFVTPAELVDGLCPDHRAAPQRVVERNWFFRLSRHAEALVDAIESGRLRVEPEQRRNEVLGFIGGGLEDFSVSRSRARARGWGIPVPGDDGQVVYVWFDALGNYVTALDYGSNGALFDTWWADGAERVHVIGKGILRFHAVYWPALLLSAGERLPSAVFVHDYLTVDGVKLSKSTGGGALDPFALAERYGVDALRWWFVRDVPRSGDADVREQLIALRANELADGLGNLVNRTLALVARSRPGGVRAVDPPSAAGVLLGQLAGVARVVDEALEQFDLRSASGALWAVVAEANRFVAQTRPWDLARAERAAGLEDARLDGVLGVLLHVCDRLAGELRPFLPGAAARIEAALERRDPGLGRVLFAKVEVPA